jgi:PAS domain S-box-containing protein
MMTRNRNSPLLSYGLALLNVALTSVVSLWLGSWIKPTPLALFYVAVMVSAWYGGLKPGLVATVLSALAINYFIPPYNALGIVDPGDLLRLGVFVIIALLISRLNQSRQVALRQEQQLRAEAEAAQRRTAHLLEHMTDAFVAFDRHWRYTYANPAALQMLQKSLEELIGKNVWEEVFPSEKGGLTYRQLHRALEEQVPASWEEFGEPVQRWLEVRAYPSLEGVAIYFQDITERKQAEAALRQNEEQLRLATEGANLGLWHWDVLHDRLIWTDQCKALFGLPADTEMSYQVFLNAVHPDDRQRLQEMRPVLEDGQLAHHEIEYRTLWSDGTVRWLMARGSASYDTAGKPIFSRGVIFDITDRKQAEIAIHQAEERLKLAVEAGRMIAWEWNPFDDSLITSANLSEIYGVNNIHTVEQGIALLHPEDRSQHRATVAQAVETRSSYYCEFRIIRPDTGAIVWLEERGQPILNEDGSLQKLIGITIDISDRKRIEEELRKSEQQLRSAIEVARFSPYEWNPVTGELIWDARLKAMWGLAPDAEVNYAVHAVGVHPEDCEYVEQQVAKAIDPNGDGIYEAEFRVIGIEDGIERWISTRGQTFFDAERCPVYYVGVAQDISDRKRAEAALRESEERFRVLADCAPSLIWLNGADGGCEFVNQAYLDFFGKTLEEVQGFRWQIDLHPDDAEEYVSAYLEAFRERKPFQAKVRIRRADGQYRWLDCYAAPRFSNSGDLLGYVGTSFDITDRRQTEEALRESEERLRLAMEAAQMGSWDLDIKTGKLLWSEQYFKVLGYEPVVTGEVSYEMWSSRVHPDDREFVLQRWQQSGLDHQLYRAEYRVIRADTTEIAWVASLGSFTYDETGQPIRALGVVFDITDRKQAEIALRESEERYRTLFESIDEGFCIIEVIFDDDKRPIDYRFLVVNPAFEKQTGLSNVIGKTIQEIAPQNEEYWYENYGNVALTGESTRFENLAQEFNSWYEVHAFRVGEPDLRRVGILFNNITERKQAEEELRQKNAILNVINETTPTPIFVKDRQGRIIYANPATLEVLGRPASEVIGYRDIDLYPNPEDAIRVLENDQRIMSSGQMEVVEESPDGIRTFLGIKVPYHDEFGEVIGLIGISNDISERVQIERDRERILQQEQAAREAAETANRIKDEFLAVLSHELRSPLNPILGWSRLLLNGNLDASRTKLALATIERNAKLQSELIEDLLDVSRILQGKLSLTVSPIDLKLTIQAAIETVRLAAEAKSIAIETRLDSEIGLVSGDSTRLQQVVWNLLSNAVKFTPTGGQVTVQLEQVNDHAQITVCDTGKGISADFLPYVFDYFRQADSTTTRQFGGLGLGLAIVRHLVELHGGTIQADSPGESLGATFTVKLPLMANEITVSRAFPLSQQPLSLQGIQILVVDDETDTRDLIAFLLEQAGATVVTAASASEALTLFIRYKPDLLVSDVGMPEMNGYMLMKQIRTLPPDQGGQVKAIALTAYAGDFDQQQALQAGFQRHLAKPIEPQELIQAVSALCNSTETWQKPNFQGAIE